MRRLVSPSSLNRVISHGHKDAAFLRKGEVIQYETMLVGSLLILYDLEAPGSLCGRGGEGDSSIPA